MRRGRGITPLVYRREISAGRTCVPRVRRGFRLKNGPERKDFMQVRFVPAATPERIAAVAALADKVWNEHYAGLLAPRRSPIWWTSSNRRWPSPAKSRQEGYRYFLLELDGRAAGYTLCK